jgi:ACS family hexuronate transporter-like MFS transporter
MTASRLRWVVVAVFMLSSALNYLDRQILAAVAPSLKAEFGMTNENFGQLIRIFSITYAAAAPLMGLFLDKYGLTRGIVFAVALWSAAGMGTAFVSSFAGLMAARALLGVGEAAGIPSTGKVAHLYLLPKERGVGAALSSIGLSIGAIAAPWLVNAVEPHYGWRGAFFVAGCLGFVWIPLWLLIERRAEKRPEALSAVRQDPRVLLRDKQMWGFVVGNICSMGAYTLWTNWTTIFLVTRYGLSQVAANELAPLPHFFAYFGGLTGGIISYRLIARGMEPLAARRMALLVSAVFLSSTIFVPMMPTPLLGAIAASFSFFWAASWGVSLYTMPVDAYGANAAFGVSLLTMAYGILQILVSPLIGETIDAVGFGPVCLVAGLLPLLGFGIVWATRHR